jgi:hypothetical protein
VSPVIFLHYWLGVAVVAINLLAGVWGIAVWRGWLVPSRTFGHALALSQTVIIGQAVIGLILLGSNLRAMEQLHYVYGLLPAALVVFAYSARGRNERRNILIFAIAALLAAALAVRAFMSAGAL